MAYLPQYFFSLFLNDFDIFRKKKTYMAGLRLHTFWSILRNYVLEAIQTRTVSNFGTFYYMFIVNVGLYKEPEFAPTKIHHKLKQKHPFYLENTKIVQIRLHRSFICLRFEENTS